MIITNLAEIVGRPVPPDATGRDIILAALLGGKAREIGEGQDRLLAAVPGLLDDGLIMQDGEKYRLTPGAADAASAARLRMMAARREREIWGIEFQEKLREMRQSSSTEDPAAGF